MDVAASHLRRGNTKSCGCWKLDNLSVIKRVHGGCGTKLYGIWAAMKARCYQPKSERYPRYGGRGITVCPEWKDDYKTFSAWSRANGYAEGLSIERKDIDGNYEPGNCTWIPLASQQRNTSASRRITAFGETKILADWCRDPRCSVEESSLAERLDHYWHPEDAISTPARGRPQRAMLIRSQIAATSSVLTPQELMDEEWAPIPGFEDYDASDFGRVRSHLKGGRAACNPRLLKIVQSGGRAQVSLRTVSGAGRTYRLARLVLMAHVGPPPTGMHACHFPDPNPMNCRLSNLRWDTPSGNMSDRKRLNELLLGMIDG